MNKKYISIILVLLIIPLISSAGEPLKMEGQIDQRSYRLGSFGAFAEMVKVGVKTLALSSAVSPKEMDAMLEEAQRIADNENLMIYREADLLVSDLFPANVAVGKHVLLIYQGDTLEKYLDLKRQKSELLSKGTYSGEARSEIARQFGRLLSYPEDIIEEKLERNR